MSVKYRSTRGVDHYRFEEVVLNGMADDKGLYVPEFIPQMTLEEIRAVRNPFSYIYCRNLALSKMAALSYPDIVVKILSLFICEDEVPHQTLKSIAEKSYSEFRVPGEIYEKIFY